MENRSVLTARREVDLCRVASACCQPQLSALR
ncbi:putative leader peptide [Streptacidiphilus sp. N1-10]|uniref:Leader peptide n=1 Tax=Streptacidiphilus jeojiensis TaxID=3229225 RepID=A0ABV6XFS8_9ACTN